jgi:hypothetical protein
LEDLYIQKQGACMHPQRPQTKQEQ